MPKTPIDYAKTIIYKLVHKDDLYDENIYTGHTTDFICRKNSHKSKCNTPTNDQYNQKKYKYIRENGGWDEWLMIEIEKYPCKDEHEAIARERVIQTEMKAKLNSVIAGRTTKEWYVDNREKQLDKQKQYYHNNREKCLEKNKQYNLDNNDEITEYKKQYYRDNREKLSKKSKQYHEDNYDKILEQKKQKIPCDHCGVLITKPHMGRHKKTQKCINFKPS